MKKTGPRWSTVDCPEANISIVLHKVFTANVLQKLFHSVRIAIEDINTVNLFLTFCLPIKRPLNREMVYYSNLLNILSHSRPLKSRVQIGLFSKVLLKRSLLILDKDISAYVNYICKIKTFFYLDMMTLMSRKRQRPVMNHHVLFCQSDGSPHDK